MSTVKRIAANSIYQFAGKFIVLGLSLAMVALLARRLGVGSYGAYTTAMAYSQLFAIVADLGIGVYLLKRLSSAEKFGEAEGKILGSAVGVRIATAIAGSVIALAITYFLPYDSLKRQAIAVAIAAVIIQMVNGLFVTVLQSKLEMKFAVTSEIVGRAVTFFGVVAALVYGQGIAAVFAAQVLGNLANLAITYVFSRKFVAPVWKFEYAEWKGIVRASALIGVSSVLSYIYFKTDTFLLSVLDIPGRSNDVEVGLYGTAYKLIEVLVIVPGIFMGSIFPLFSAAVARNESANAGKLVARSFQIMLGTGVAATAGLYLFADEAIRFIAGPEYADAVLPLKILAFAVPFNFIGSAFSYALLGLEKQRALAWLYGLIAIANVSANIYFIPRHSYVAAAWVTVSTELLVGIGGYLLLRSAFPVRVRLVESAVLAAGIVGSAVISASLPGALGLWRLLIFAAFLAGIGAVFYRRVVSDLS